MQGEHGVVVNLDRLDGTCIPNKKQFLASFPLQSDDL
jgi:hypothetical protein